ncbi:MAG TPA: exosortase K [Pyrinomonadaceae bacterium]|nr:exosortase K [Pyrinomonadaceae bacterium]
MKPKLVWSAQLALVGLCALALKFYYSTATADELCWILAPTTTLVELLSGTRFEFESYAGYITSDRTFVIAVPCAGVNFLITAFLMLALRRLWLGRFQPLGWRFIPVSAMFAYLGTLSANTTRICLALELRARSVEITGLTNNQMHRLEGIVVYFGFLLLLFLLTENFESAKPARLARVLPFPLLIYYAMTLAVPLLNGSFKRGDAFREHAVFVLLLPLVFVVPLTFFYVWRTRLNRSATALHSDGSAYPPRLLRRGSFVWRHLRIPETEHRQCLESRLQFPNQSA